MKLVVAFLILFLSLSSWAVGHEDTDKDHVHVVQADAEDDDGLLGSFGVGSQESDDDWMPTDEEVQKVFGPGTETVEAIWDEEEAQRKEEQEEHFHHLHQMGFRGKAVSHDKNLEPWTESREMRDFVDKAVSDDENEGSEGSVDGEKFPPEYLERLKRTKWVNEEEVIHGLQIQWPYPPATPLTFKLRNPYWPPHKVPGSKARGPESLHKWFSTYNQNKSVCALKWLDERKYEYRLQTFPSRAAAENAGYIVTHDKGCGGCSSLLDLSVYLGEADLTEPTRTCSRRPMASLTKVCLEHHIGFSKRCAEAWTYTIGCTKLFCSLTCIKDYGFANVILNRLRKFPDNLPNGELRPCIECDELTSGPGFKYGAGRTRRNSGIESNIKRDPGEISKIDHWAYFK